MREKIADEREATSSSDDDNAVVDVLGSDRLLADGRRLLAGRGGQAALVVALTLATLGEARLVEEPGGSTVGRGTALGLLPLTVVPLVLSRRWPTLAAVSATFLTVALLGTHQTPLSIFPFCVLVFVVAQLVARRGLVFAVPLLVPFVINTGRPLDGGHSSLSSAIPLLFLLAALVIGEAMRKRGLAVAALGESTRAQVVMEERARIARELHDIVAHHLSVITVESEVARLTSPELPGDAAGRFESIASTAREALNETRRLLGVLRDDVAAKPERAPQPGLDDLDDLVQRAQATGTPVRLVREGRIARLPRGVDLAAYRIVQEALTNARRHAPGAAVDVEVSYTADALRLHIRDHGPGLVDGDAPEGHGLMGMRERAMLAGGTFSAGPAEGDGFEVLATLPVGETAE